MSKKISEEFRIKLLNVARQSLENFLANNEYNQFKTEIPELLEQRAVFVTLRNRRNGSLRGCIGHSKPRYPLIEAVAKTAISSAVEDSRFPSLTINELPSMLIEINVLSHFESSKPADVEIGKHGLMIKKGSKGAIFLPEVAVSNCWNLNSYFEELCRKADLPEGCWLDREAKIYVFESEAWSENDFPN